MNYDYEKALTDAMDKVMKRVDMRLYGMKIWFIHDYLFFSDIPYEEARAMELRAFGCVGGH